MLPLLPCSQWHKSGATHLPCWHEGQQRGFRHRHPPQPVKSMLMLLNCPLTVDFIVRCQTSLSFISPSFISSLSGPGSQEQQPPVRRQAADHFCCLCGLHAVCVLMNSMNCKDPLVLIKRYLSSFTVGTLVWDANLDLFSRTTKVVLMVFATQPERIASGT